MLKNLVAAVLLLAAGAPMLRGQAPPPSAPPSETAALIGALLRDLVLPERNRMFPATPPTKVFLAEETLALCPSSVTGPCIHGLVLERATAEAAKGRWPSSAVTLLASVNPQPGRLAGIEHSDILLGPRAEWVKVRPLLPPLAISTPAVADDQALVYVQFRQGISWLAWLSKRDGIWRVTNSVVVGVS